MKPSLAALSNYDYFGVLVLRLGAGLLSAFHGFTVLSGGKDAWAEIGAGAAVITLQPDLFWVAGLASALAQGLGGLLLILGLLTRGTAVAITFISALALANLIQDRTFGLAFFAHLQIVLLYFSLVFIGPGRLSLDRKGI